ncbi:MAG: glutaminyl-peptide cyclotransferase [Dehalococcoidia bacterium]
MIFKGLINILVTVILVILPGIILSPSCSNSSGNSPSNEVITYTYEIVQTYPHDRNAFTQGLVFADGFLYEGTGLHGRSTTRKVLPETGEVIQIYELPARFFGEGITIYKDSLIQLTWQSGIGFVYDKSTFELLDEFSYDCEGWGLTTDGERLIMSDGSATIYFREPESFREITRIEVKDGDNPVVRLNELEYVQGEIYANIWQTDLIAIIDAETGQITGWVNLRGLLAPEEQTQPVDVLNGIAYDAKNDRLFVTGKLWPRTFEIKLIPIKP